MIASDYKDLDGFKLQFEENCPKKDKEYFVKVYPKVDFVADKKLHCTTCDFHIGTAPISEKIIRTHMILGVTQCNKCYAFYNSGEFGKGEDGSEYYCRWCGQGGEVFCCSTCAYVFCNKCIRSNLSSSYVREIEENDDWSCFVCNNDILKNQRAQHWALRNFMNKQLEIIQKTNVTSEDELNNLLNEDASNCCPRKKRKSVIKPQPAPVKRPSTNSAFMNFAPPAKKINLQQALSKPRTFPPQVKIQCKTMLPQTSPSSSRPGQKSKDIVCTPDLMGLFNNEDSSFASNNMIPSTSVAPPPLVLRNHQRPMLRPVQPSPIYHNVNGYQIDLNHASRQEIFRLPNGKLIQVRKQTAPSTSTSITIRPGSIVAPRGPQFTIRQAAQTMQTTARMFRPQAPQRPPAPIQQTRFRSNGQPQQRFTFSDGRVLSTPIIPPQPPAPPLPSSTIFTQQNGSISVARAPQPDTPFGKSKTEFEDKIISGMEICQHTINKMITLSNSTSFKTSRSFSDLKDLYIHLQYLFTYTSGKFTTLQESLKTGMEGLAVFDEKLKEKCDDDELEIVEQKTDVIEVMSDDEEAEAAETKKQKPGPVCSKKPQLKKIENQTENTGGSFVALEDMSGVSITFAKNDSSDHEENSSSSFDFSKAIAKDKKLSNKVLVKVEKLEDSKDVIIKEYVSKLQERQLTLASNDSSREGTPDESGSKEDEAEGACSDLLCNEVLMQRKIDSVIVEDDNSQETIATAVTATDPEVVENKDKEEAREVDETSSLIAIDLDDVVGEMSVEKSAGSLVEDETATVEILAEDVDKETSAMVVENNDTKKDENLSEEKVLDISKLPSDEEKKSDDSEKDPSKERDQVSPEIISNADEEVKVLEEALKENEAPKVSDEDDLFVEVQSSKVSEETTQASEKNELSSKEDKLVDGNSETLDLNSSSSLCIHEDPIAEITNIESSIDDEKEEEEEEKQISETLLGGLTAPQSLTEATVLIGSSQETLDLNNTSIISLDSTSELDEELNEDKSQLNSDATMNEVSDKTAMIEQENIASDDKKELESLTESEEKSKSITTEADEEQTLLNDLIDTLSRETMEID